MSSISVVGKFSKVDLNIFSDALKANIPGIPESETGRLYEAVRLPARATAGSAGYDFYSTLDFKLKPGESVLIPTAVRVRIEPGWMLAIFPRSGLGFKYRFQLNNTVGIIDSDYYYADNQGHIMCRMINDSREGKDLEIHRGDAFAQGIFIPFGITEDDEATGVRTGGFGSTG